MVSIQFWYIRYGINLNLGQVGMVVVYNINIGFCIHINLSFNGILAINLGFDIRYKSRF